MNLCECCGVENGWGLMEPDFEFVCLPCAEQGQEPVMFIEGRYRKYAKCGCGDYGPINYEEDRYYCGKQPSCCP